MNDEEPLSKAIREALSDHKTSPHPSTSAHSHSHASPPKPAQRTYWSSTGELDNSSPPSVKHQEPTTRGIRVESQEVYRLTQDVVYWKAKADAFERKLKELKAILDG